LDEETIDWMLRGEPAAHRGLTLPPGGVDAPFVLEIIRDIMRNLHSASCRASWAIVSDGEVVGLCGYRRPPRAGSVEIGYGIAESRRKLGHATHAVQAMIELAQADPQMRSLTAETSVHNPASERVLEKNGFERTGNRHDAEDGELTGWRRLLSSSP
jgi:RimJ/RimL family protein N-acetyltransferase